MFALGEEGHASLFEQLVACILSFFVLPIFYGVTSEGLGRVPGLKHR